MSYKKRTSWEKYKQENEIITKKYPASKEISGGLGNHERILVLSVKQTGGKYATLYYYIWLESSIKNKRTAPEIETFSFIKN